MADVEGQPFKQRAIQEVRRRAPLLGLHGLRWIWFYLAILLGYLAQEDYFPFSDWPMYSDFAKSATYVYAVDGHGNEVGWRTFGYTAAPTKRQYERERNRIQREQGVDRDTANVLAGEVLMQRLARRLAADQLEKMGDSLTIHYIGVAFNERHEMEHRHKATSVIELAPILVEKRAEEAAAAQEAGETIEQGDGTDADGSPTEGAANPGSSAFWILSLKEVMV